MQKSISGNKIASKIKEQIKKEISLLNREIVFSIIYVGQDPVIDNFIRYKKKFGEEVGVSVVVYNLDKNISERELLTEVERIYSLENNDAVIIQLPLPSHVESQVVLDIVPVAMDVDVLGGEAKDLFKSDDNLMFPPVTGAMVEVLKSENYNLEGKNIVLVGYGNLVGKPFAVWLDRQNIKYNIVDSETLEEEKKILLKNADLIISGVGISGLIKPEMIKEGVVLLDGGTAEEGKKVIGDIDPGCYEKALFYTPVPGGIGPLTIAVLYQNILKTKKMNELLR